MALLGPDGKPLGRGALVGGPKTLMDLGPFKDADIEQFINTFEAMLVAGQPLEVPAALPTGDFCRLACTLKVRGERIKDLEAQLATLQPPAPTEEAPALFANMLAGRAPINIPSEE